MRLFAPGCYGVAASALILAALAASPLSGGVSVAQASVFLLSLPGSYFLYRLLFRFSSRPPARALLSAAQVLTPALCIGLVLRLGLPPSESFVRFLLLYPRYSLAMAAETLGGWGLAALTAAVVLSYACWRHAERSRAGLAAWGKAERLGALVWALVFLALHQLQGASAPLAAELHCARLASRLALSVLETRDEDRFVLDRMRLPRVEAPARPADPPHVLVIRLEAVARDRVGLYDPKQGTTPRLERFRDRHPGEFFVFQKHFSNSGATDVSLPMMFTGLGPSRSGADFGRFPLIWDYAKALGYRTFWLIPFRVTWGKLRDHLAMTPKRLSVDHLYHAGNSGLPMIYDLSIADYAIVDEAIRRIDEHRAEGPLFGIVSLKLSHDDGAGVEFMGYNNLRCPKGADRIDYYACSILETDYQISRLTGHLRERGLLDKTVLVIVSDHGAGQGIRRARFVNYYQEVLSIPLALYIPKRYQAPLDAESPDWRKNVDKVTSNVDLVPTLAQLWGLHKDPRFARVLKELDGRSLFAPLPAGRWVEAANTNALRRWDTEGFALVLDGRHKYIFDEGRERLFDLRDDPGERSDLLEPRGEGASALRDRFLHRISSKPVLSRIYRRKRRP